MHIRSELKKNENGHWIYKHFEYKDVLLCIYSNYCVLILHT